MADLGCGIGYISLPLVEAGCRVLALDAQKGMLEGLCDRAAPSQRGSLLPVLGELPNIPVKDGGLEHIFLVNVLHEFEDRSSMISECRRTLRSCGIVTVVDFQKKMTVMGPPLQERIEESDMAEMFPDFDTVSSQSFDAFYQFQFRKR